MMMRTPRIEVQELPVRFTYIKVPSDRKDTVRYISPECSSLVLKPYLYELAQEIQGMRDNGYPTTMEYAELLDMLKVWNRIHPYDYLEMCDVNYELINN